MLRLEAGIMCGQLSTTEAQISRRGEWGVEAVSWEVGSGQGWGVLGCQD